MNMKLFKVINGLAYKNPLLDRIMIIFSTYVPIVFMIVLAGAYFYGVYREEKLLRYAAVDTFIITVINLLLAYVIGILYYVPRPFVSNKVNLLVPHMVDASFPSDHATGTMSIALGINNYKKVLGRILIGLSCFVGISRVYVGDHYPVDVIGGYIIALLTNCLYGIVLRNKFEDIYDRLEQWLVKNISFTRQTNS